MIPAKTLYISSLMLYFKSFCLCGHTVQCINSKSESYNDIVHLLSIDVVEIIS